MSLPVSQYEALLAEMRGLRRKAQRVQQIAKPLLEGDSSASFSLLDGTVASGSLRQYQSYSERNYNNGSSEPLDYTMESLLLGRHNTTSPNYDHGVESSVEGDNVCSEDEYGGATRNSTKLSVSSEPTPDSNRIAGLYHGTWPVEKNMWNSEPTSLGTKGNAQNVRQNIGHQLEVTSVMSFASSSGGVPLDRVLGSPDRNKWSSQQLEAKMDVVHSLLSMLGGQEHIDMGETLLALSTCPESCLAMRQSGCIPLLVQLVQSDKDSDNRKKAAQALQNLVHSQPDEKIRKRESRVFKLLQHCRAYTEALKNDTDLDQIDTSSTNSEDGDKHPVQTVAHLMKLSFDEGHRQAICQLGGIHTIATLVEVEHKMHVSTSTDSHCILMRRYACMALTNLTFGDSGNKALLCSFKEFMKSLVIQLQSQSDELRQVTASVLRNLSWRADSSSKEILREVCSVSGLMKAAMMDNKENTLKSILSALWNLSAHCTDNKSEICAVDGALGFLVDLLTYKTPSKSLAIIENSGGILRNISSQIAVREDYRAILRQHNCLQILLDQLKSPSLTIVSNACGTLWNLSAKCQEDQETLWQMGAPTMLSSLNHSKHKMIAMGSSAALKNLLSAKPQNMFQPQLDSTALSLDLPSLPTLGARKQKAFIQNLDPTLSETYENIEKDSPIKKEPIIKSELQELNSNFASLNLNEPSTSYSSDPRLSARITQNYGSNSLPYKRPSCTFIAVRNKFSDCAYDDEMDISDQPIDYSKKYSETKVPSIENPNTSLRKDNYSFNKPPDEKESFSIYAETDLDQPTDYSLRYAEDDSDSEIAKNEDTVKTYCTEDTPYETPFNFSTATSLSDLRMDDKQVIDNDKLKERESKNNKKINETPEEKERCSTEDISELNHRTTITDKIPKSELSSGLMSPEKPVNYAEEGTPGYFSRVSSFGSLNSIPGNETVKEQKESVNRELDCDRKEVKKVSPKVAAEAKAVKFERVVNYAEETPLMFSRSSSLASLDSIEQHSIHDDRSSVVSDFSRLTSGIVSPSELPDSPTQTVPPSPKPRKNSSDFPSSSKAMSSSERTPQPVSRSLAKPSIFEDNITKFKEESTPIQFSTATSLSSLTIDDHEDPEDAASEQAAGQKSPENASHEEEKVENEEVEKKDKEKETALSDINDDFVIESDVDEDILADCISIGMQNNRHNQTKSIPTSTPTKLPVSSFKYTSKGVQNSSIPMPRSNPRMISQQNNSRTFQNNSETPGNQRDTIRTYYTEDTPVRLSNAASNSDLSLLSVSNGKDGSRKGDYLSDDSSNLSGDNDNILAECIQSAMPKAKKESKIPSKPSVPSSLPRRNIPCGTTAKSAPAPHGSVNTRGLEAPKVPPSSTDLNRRDHSLPVYLNARDEVENYEVENSPCHFSLRSSLSDLTVDGSVAALNRNGGNLQKEDPSIKSEVAEGQQIQSANSTTQHNVSQQSRRESLSSISVESLGSIEAEQALLAQCISSGMPKSHSETRTKPLDIPQSRSNSMNFVSHSYDSSSPPSDVHPKNVSAASVAGSTRDPLTANTPCPTTNQSSAVAGVERNPETPRERGTKEEENKKRVQEVPGRTGIPIKNIPHTDMSQDRCSPIGEISSPGTAKNGSRDSLHKILDVMEERLVRSCDDSKVVDNRMLDPDAMIESLDRFTAELVSQASHLNKDENYKVSTGDNTWNEEVSPNDVTFPSLSGSTPNIITFSHEEEEKQEINDIPNDTNHPSNDFSSINTSTMTDSTLIALEASKMATVFKQEAEMSTSITSAASLELDHVQPPSHLNSLNNSAIGLPRSPKLSRRKKSLPAGLMVRRALNNSLNNGSSLESLSNLDHVNPPSDLLFDMEGSMTSVASLPSDQKADFMINGIIHKEFLNTQHPIFDLKQPFSELENINPPSLFNEITDFCNSLADVPTEAICSETDIFEDCFTHIIDEDSTVADVTITEDAIDGIAESVMETLNNIDDDDEDITLFSDAKSSIESTPKKKSNLSKSMTTKQRRNQARDRYKTYTIGAEMVMREEIEKQKESSDTTTESFITANIDSRLADEDNTVTSFPSTVSSVGKEKLTPKEKRLINRSRFETQILDQAITNILQQPVIAPSPLQDQTIQSSNSNSCSSSPAQSPARTKLSIRRNFIQKRLENKERFRTRTLSETSFSPEVTSSSPTLNGESEVQLHLQKEANRVLKTLRETKTQDELLDCETLSLVSNDDDSEYNSGSSVNYRTYHKSWGLKKNIPVISNELIHSSESNPVEETASDEDEEQIRQEKISIGKPKIIKPEKKSTKIDMVIEEQPKGIRGRRKPLYSKTVTSSTPKNIKPVKNMTSNLVKNVTSTFKSGTILKNVTRQIKNVTPTTPSRASSGYGSRSVSKTTSPKISPARTPASSRSSPKHTLLSKTAVASLKVTPPVERQGTFTKDESPSSTTPTPPKPTSKIPTVTKIPAFTSKNASKLTAPTPISKISGKPPVNRINGFVKSASSDRANKNPRVYNRSTSADSREQTSRKIQASPSSQSLKGDVKLHQNGAVKKSSIPSPTQRSNSNSSLNSTGSSNTIKKQVTSKIASLWKRIEDSKKQPVKQDGRVWIQPEIEKEPPRLIRSNTFDNKDGLGLNSTPEKDEVCISRLDSYILTDEGDGLSTDSF